MAAIQGIDLDAGAKQETEDAFGRARRRAEARIRGVSVEDVDRSEDAAMFGIEFEVEE